MNGMAGAAYRDLSRPPLHAGRLARALVVDDGVWSQIRVVAATGSTNADLAAAARRGEPEGLVLVAESQSAGRGRLDRVWAAPPRSSITMSVLLRPDVPAVRLGWLPLLAGAALVETVGRVAVVDAAVKWPNDLLVRPAAGADGYGKCAGVLAEAVPGAVVLGIGLNVSQRADELPPPIDRSAFPSTSLALAGAACVDRDPLVRAILRGLGEWYRRWCATDGDPEQCGLRQAYRDACHTIRQEVTVGLPDGEIVRGQARDVDLDGRLLIATGAGVRPLAAGDVLAVR